MSELFIQEKNNIHQQIDQEELDSNISEDTSVYYRMKKVEKQPVSGSLNQTSNNNNKKMNFLNAKNLLQDDEVYDEFQFEQDTSVQTQISEKVLRKIDQLKLETIEKEVQGTNVNKQLEIDSEYYQKLAVKSAIDLIDQAGKKEMIADDMIREDANNNASKNMRNAWIANTVEKKYNNDSGISAKESPKNRQNEREAILSGFMLKFQKNLIINNTWKQVQCELSSNYFQVFVEKEGRSEGQPSKYQLTDSINIKDFVVTIESAIEDNINELVLKLEYSDYILRLRQSPDSKTPLSKWKEEIQKQILQSKTTQKYKLDELRMGLTLQNEVIFESEFVNKARSGDIVLFHTDSIAATMQRKTTFSKFDHVGIVIRLRDNFVRIFDSTGDGVELTEWNKFVYQNGQYQAMTYRKLNYNKREKVLPALYNFVLQANGKKYGMNILKFAKMNSVVGDNSTKNKEKDTTYFCSELVAKCFKEMGLLNQITSSTQYWPRSFSTEYEDKELVLYDNAYLEKEQMVLLDADIQKVY